MKIEGIKAVPSPPIEGIARKVDRGPLMITPDLGYVYGQVVWNNRGEMGYVYREALSASHPISTEHFLLHLKIDTADREARPELHGIEEIWVGLIPRKGTN